MDRRRVALELDLQRELPARASRAAENRAQIGTEVIERRELRRFL